MKKKLFLIISICSVVAMSLAACGNGQAKEPVEQLTQTTELADYSSYVTLGQYTDLSIPVSDSAVSQEALQEAVDDFVTGYSYYYLQSGGSLEWGDELVTSLTNGEYKSAKKYEEHLYEQLEKKAREDQQKEYRSGLWDAVLANCVFGELPVDIIEENAEKYYANEKAAYETYASYYGYTYDQYLQEIQGITDEELREEFYEYARQELVKLYTAATIYRHLGMEMTDDEFSEGVAELAATYGYESSAELVQRYGEEYVREVLVTRAVEEYLAEHNTMAVSGQGQ